MPLHGPLPIHVGELNLANQLVSIDDGKLHLWFDLCIPGVANIDILVWDEDSGVFCLEVKAIPLDFIEDMTFAEISIKDRGRSRSPMGQARHASYELLSYLRKKIDNPPWLSSTVVWPKISRNSWRSHWDSSDFPPGFADSMFFLEDLDSINKLRHRLKWLREHSPWGSGKPKAFRHEANEFKKLCSLLDCRISAKESYAKPERKNFRDKISLDTDIILDSADALEQLIVDARVPMPESDWGIRFESRLNEIRERLGRPFKLGIVGEFRAGKSSVLNAIVGNHIAVVSEFECTFCPQRVAYGETAITNVFYDNSQEWTGSIADAQELLKEAEDIHNNNGIIRVDTLLPAPILSTIELWDSPGFGGSDKHEKVADDFVEEIDAAIWVFNKDYIGQESLDDVLNKLRHRGKLIIGVVNKCENNSLSEFSNIKQRLAQTYPEIQFADILPFSAKKALSPGNAGEVTDESGNIELLLDILRKHIIKNPSRLSSTAAAGDLRALTFAVRDEIQKILINERRSIYQYKTQVERTLEILKEKLLELSRDLKREALAVVRNKLSEECDIAIALRRISLDDLKNIAHFEKLIKGSINEKNVKTILDNFFEDQRNRIKETVRAAGILTFSDYVSRLTDVERVNLNLPQEINVDDIFNGAETVGKATGLAVFTGGTLGVMALAIPGPQWPFVLVGTGLAFLSSLISGAKDQDLSYDELSKIRENQWKESINQFIELIGNDVSNAIDKVLNDVEEQAINELQKQIMIALLGNISPEDKVSSLRKLDSLRQGAEMIIENLGDPRLALPEIDANINNPASINAGELERSRSLLQRIFGASLEMVAITDGKMNSSNFPIFMSVPDATVIRILAWEQPTSSIGEGFRHELQEIRGKRAGSINVVAPIPEGIKHESLPNDTWIFIPGWAYRFDRPIADIWNSSHHFNFTPLEDDGSLYYQYFGRWFDGDVDGYQAMQL